MRNEGKNVIDNVILWLNKFIFKLKVNYWWNINSFNQSNIVNDF